MEEGKEVARLRKDELTLKFEEEDITLMVAVKLPNEFPRVLPLTIEDLSIFLEEGFPVYWKEIGEKVLNELIRGTG